MFKMFVKFKMEIQKESLQMFAIIQFKVIARLSCEAIKIKINYVYIKLFFSTFLYGYEI